MAFKFRWLCELLQKLEQNRVSKASAASRTVNPDNQVIVTWFNTHRVQIPRHGYGAVAFLSCLFPERRPDRVYNLQRKRLASTFGRSLGLGTGRMKELNSWQERDGSDFPQCVEAAMAQAEFDEPAPGQELTLEELDQALDELAARSPFSSPTIRSYRDPREADAILVSLLHKLQSWEAKWLVRMILVNFSPVIVPEHLAMDLFHFLLRDLLDLQNSFEAAATILSRARISRLPSRPARDCQAALKLGIMGELVPQIGVMIRRPSCEKARSMKHCCQMAANRQMSLERKYDGEYCQVHIDLTNRNDCIKIFSKSGKDSTADRVRLHGALKDCLGISASEGRIKKHCILEGELLVWNKRTKAIEPFHKIRKHVQHSGRWLGNQADSPASLDEHLMIMFYDILLLDDKIVLRETHNKRRQRLESLVKPTPGYAEIGTREKINFSSRRAPQQLRSAFAAAITQNWEGLVLKGCDEPYLPFNGTGRCIKLKKDYITGLGDTADFAIVGGRRDAKTEQNFRLGKLSWTSFYVGCLENKAEVQRFDAKPVYRIVDIVSEHNMSKDDILFLNEHGKFVQVPFAAFREELVVNMDQRSMARPTELFKQAFVAEIYGAGFTKPADTRSFTLRFPRVLKIHLDRPVSETVSFDELQKLGHASHQAPVDADSQKDREWIERLEKADPKSRYIIDKSQSTTSGKSPGSTETVSTTATPNMRTKLRSTVLVRTDTNELSPTDFSEREETESSRLFHSQSSGQHRPGGSKRKLLSADVTPEANISNKRVKFLEAAPTAPQPGDRQLDQAQDLRKTDSSPCEGVTGRMGATVRVDLKTTPPWCKWSGQTEPSPTSLPRSSVPPEPQRRESRRPTEVNTRSIAKQALTSRLPLADITNSSPEHARQPIPPTVQQSPDRAKERGSPELGRASKLRKRLREASSSMKAQPPHLIGNTAVLPTTPPISSRADAQANTPRSTPSSPNIVPSSSSAPQPGRLAAGAKGPAVDESTVGVTPPRQRQATQNQSTIRVAATRTDRRCLLSASPVLLSQSITYLSTHPARPLEALLRHAAVAFTHSREHFFSTLTVSAGLPHVVLVDVARPDSVAQEMKAMFDELKKASWRTAWQGKRRVVFFLDWNALRILDAGAAAAVINDLKPYFGGCLAWKLKNQGHDAENLQNISVEPIWSLDEAMIFSEHR
jgi:DNA ligase 4